MALLTENSFRVGDTCRIGGQTGEIKDVTLWSGTAIAFPSRTVSLAGRETAEPA